MHATLGRSARRSLEFVGARPLSCFWNSPAELDTLFDTASIFAFHFRLFPPADGRVLGNARDSFAEATVPRTRISTASCDFQCLFSPMGTRLTLTRLCESLACALGICYTYIYIYIYMRTCTHAQKHNSMHVRI